MQSGDLFTLLTSWLHVSRPLGEHDGERSRFLSPFLGLTGLISGAAKISITKAVDHRVYFSYQI